MFDILFQLHFVSSSTSLDLLFFQIHRFYLFLKHGDQTWGIPDAFEAK